MIAPSYQKNYTIESEPFKKNGKNYVKIRHNRTGNTRDARWYTESEYAKAYPKEKCAFTVSAGAAHKVHDVLGFGGPKDTIRIYCGSCAKDLNFEPLKSSNARFHKLWGWYIPYGEEDPMEGKGVVSIDLPWSFIGNEDGTLKSDKHVTDMIDSMKKAVLQQLRLEHF